MTSADVGGDEIVGVGIVGADVSATSGVTRQEEALRDKAAAAAAAASVVPIKGRQGSQPVPPVVPATSAEAAVR